MSSAPVPCSSSDVPMINPPPEADAESSDIAILEVVRSNGESFFLRIRSIDTESPSYHQHGTTVRAVLGTSISKCNESGTGQEKSRSSSSKPSAITLAIPYEAEIVRDAFGEDSETLLEDIRVQQKIISDLNDGTIISHPLMRLSVNHAQVLISDALLQLEPEAGTVPPSVLELLPLQDDDGYDSSSSASGSVSARSGRRSARYKNKIVSRIGSKRRRGECGSSKEVPDTVVPVLGNINLSSSAPGTARSANPIDNKVIREDIEKLEELLSRADTMSNDGGSLNNYNQNKPLHNDFPLFKVNFRVFVIARGMDESEMDKLRSIPITEIHQIPQQQIQQQMNTMINQNPAVARQNIRLPLNYLTMGQGIASGSAPPTNMNSARFTTPRLSGPGPASHDSPRKDKYDITPRVEATSPRVNVTDNTTTTSNKPLAFSPRLFDKNFTPRPILKQENTSSASSPRREPQPVIKEIPIGKEVIDEDDDVTPRSKDGANSSAAASARGNNPNLNQNVVFSGSSEPPLSGRDSFSMRGSGFQEAQMFDPSNIPAGYLSLTNASSYLTPPSPAIVQWWKFLQARRHEPFPRLCEYVYQMDDTALNALDPKTGFNWITSVIRREWNFGINPETMELLDPVRFDRTCGEEIHRCALVMAIWAQARTRWERRTFEQGCSNEPATGTVGFNPSVQVHTPGSLLNSKRVGSASSLIGIASASSNLNNIREDEGDGDEKSTSSKSSSIAMQQDNLGEPQILTNLGGSSSSSQQQAATNTTSNLIGDTPRYVKAKSDFLTCLVAFVLSLEIRRLRWDNQMGTYTEVEDNRLPINLPMRQEIVPPDVARGGAAAQAKPFWVIIDGGSERSSDECPSFLSEVINHEFVGVEDLHYLFDLLDRNSSKSRSIPHWSGGRTSSRPSKSPRDPSKSLNETTAGGGGTSSALHSHRTPRNPTSVTASTESPMTAAAAANRTSGSLLTVGAAEVKQDSDRISKQKSVSPVPSDINTPDSARSDINKQSSGRPSSKSDPSHSTPASPPVAGFSFVPKPRDGKETLSLVSGELSTAVPSLNANISQSLGSEPTTSLGKTNSTTAEADQEDLIDKHKNNTISLTPEATVESRSSSSTDIVNKNENSDSIKMEVDETQDKKSSLTSPTISEQPKVPVLADLTELQPHQKYTAFRTNTNNINNYSNNVNVSSSSSLANILKANSNTNLMIDDTPRDNIGYGITPRDAPPGGWMTPEITSARRNSARTPRNVGLVAQAAAGRQPQTQAQILQAQQQFFQENSWTLAGEMVLPRVNEWRCTLTWSAVAGADGVLRALLRSPRMNSELFERMAVSVFPRMCISYQRPPRIWSPSPSNQILPNAVGGGSSPASGGAGGITSPVSSPLSPRQDRIDANNPLRMLLMHRLMTPELFAHLIKNDGFCLLHFLAQLRKDAALIQLLECPLVTKEILEIKLDRKGLPGLLDCIVGYVKLSKDTVPESEDEEDWDEDDEGNTST